MTTGDDLFESYRRFKGVNVDNPQYEPLGKVVVNKETLKKLKAKEYNEKNKDRLKIKRLEKIVAELREDKKELESRLNWVKEMRIEVDDKHKLEDMLQIVKILVKYL